MLTLHGCQEDYFKSLKNLEKQKQNELNLRIICHFLSHKMEVRCSLDCKL